MFFCDCLPGDFPLGPEYVCGRLPGLPHVLADPEREGRALDLHAVQVDVDAVLPPGLRRERHLRKTKKGEEKLNSGRKLHEIF